jgi:predicted nucleotidyltransferase
MSEIQPTCVILFGSMAKATDRIESDVDMVVVGGDLPQDISERLLRIGRLKWGIPVSIDAFPYTEAEFERMLDDLHVTALDCMYEGIPLHGQEYFDRLKSRFDGYVRRGLRRDKVAWYFEKKAA